MHPSCPRTPRRASRCLSLTALAAAALFAPGAQAQEQLPRIEIVGSNLKRVAAEGPSPVQVLKRAEIEASGASTVFELLSSALVASTSAFNNDTSNSYAPGAASVALRGLSERNVLVLLNGRRLANFGFAQGTDSTFVDLNSLPLSAIEEVQVLRDGASAIYGSDAVAGVINFVTKRDYRGVSLGARYTQNRAGDEATRAANLAAGWGDLVSEGYNLLATLDLYQREPRLAGKHELTRSNDLRRFGGFDGRGVSRNPGSYILARTYRYAMPGCPAAHVETDARGDEYCRSDVSPDEPLTPELTRSSAAVLATLQLNPDLRAFAEFSLNHNLTDWRGSHQALENYVPARDILPGMAAYKPELGCFDGNCYDLIALRTVYEAPQARNKAISDTGRLLLGLRGQRGEWDWEAALVHAENEVRHQQFNMLKRDAVTRALRDGGYDPFALSNPESAWRPLLTDVERVSTSKLSTVDAKLSHPELFRLGQGPVGLAAGLQFMKESIADRPDAQVQAGNIENWGGTSVRGDRQVGSGFAELRLEPLSSLEVQLALRADRYSDFGNSFNPKLALAYRPTQDLLLRAGYNTAFKAPTLPQLYMNDTVSYSAGVADWLRCRPLNLGPEACVYTPKLLQKANRELDPEKTKITSFGLAYNLTREWFSSLDLYQLDQRDTIQLLNEQYLMDNEFKIPGFDKLVIRDPRNPVLEQRYPGLQHGRLNTLVVPFMNVGRIKTQGMDWAVRGSVALAGGRLSLKNELNRQFSYKQSDVAGDALTERLDGFYRPVWRNRFSIGFDAAQWGLLWTTNTTASVLNIGDPKNRRPDVAIERLPSFSTHDLSGYYKLGSDLQLQLGALNAFDKQPRFATNYGGFLDSQTGPQFYASLRYRLR